MFFITEDIICQLGNGGMKFQSDTPASMKPAEAREQVMENIKYGFAVICDRLRILRET